MVMVQKFIFLPCTTQTASIGQKKPSLETQSDLYFIQTEKNFDGDG